MSSTSGRFQDLKTRILSAVVLLIVGFAAMWLGGFVFLLLLSLVAGLMTWELVRMIGPDTDRLKVILMALIAAFAVQRVGYSQAPLALISLMLVPVLGMVIMKTDRALFAVYATAMLFAVAGLFWFRQGAGFSWTLWLVLVVAAADIGGYFFGRIMGGPKILPAISPKKTWSGTVGGWFLASLVGLGFVIWGEGQGAIVLVSVLAAAVSQAGDIAESAIKRHTGVKDASDLIPGHGGFLDRFDGLIGASLLIIVISSLPGQNLFGAF